ncbi:MAG: chemotaxis protein CheW [Pseudomonadota bacterium]
MSEESVNDTQTREYITVRIGPQLFGLQILDVHDVFNPENMTPVPMSRPELAGVLNLRGRIVTAIDMRRRLGLGDRDDDTSPMAVGIDHSGESYGLLIDEVGEVLSLADNSIEANPANLDPRWAEVSLGVQRLDGRLLVILDVSKILRFAGEALAA